MLQPPRVVRKPLWRTLVKKMPFRRVALLGTLRASVSGEFLGKFPGRFWDYSEIRLVP
jgi:hypothetical protein